MTETVQTKRPFSIVALICILIFFILMLIPFFINPSVEAFFRPVWYVSTIFTIVLFILIFINKQPRKKWYIVFTIISLIFSVGSSIVVTEFSPSISTTVNTSAKETTVSTKATSIITVSTQALETTASETTQEPLKKFSFSKYITANTREYTLVREEDISLKALGNKLPSEYTQEEIDKLPINFRMKYSIVVPHDIKEEELKSTLAYIMENKSYQDLSIDEIYVAAWYDLESVEKQICIARAEWCPEGIWEQMSPAIAANDVRDSYLVKFYFNSAIEQPELKYGLTEQQRKQVFYELVQLQDQVSMDDPNYDQKQEEAYLIVAKKYGITYDQAFAIGVEGLMNGWPMPPLE